MNQSIIYFTRTGDTKTKALKLGKETGATAYQLKDDENWQGPMGLLKGLWLSLINKKMTIKLDDEALKADQLVIMSPLWLSGPAPAVKTLLDSTTHENILLVITNHASPIDGVLKKYRAKYASVKKCYGITINKNNAEEVLEQLKKDMA